jgi:hypothetical protein
MKGHLLFFSLSSPALLTLSNGKMTEGGAISPQRYCLIMSVSSSNSYLRYLIPQSGMSEKIIGSVLEIKKILFILDSDGRVNSESPK